MQHSTLERAVKERLILRNPTEDCIAPKVQKIEMQILPPEHIKDYLEAADRRGLLPMFYLELVTGLRKGEITALLWSDLDIQNKTISVSKQYVKNPNGELTLSRPKTETSVRKVSIPQEAVDLLIAEHGKHPENPYMFPSPVTGEMYYPDSVVNLHKKILKDAGLPHIRFHDLRHPHVKHTTKKIYLYKSRNPRLPIIFDSLGFMFCVCVFWDYVSKSRLFSILRKRVLVLVYSHMDYLPFIFSNC